MIEEKGINNQIEIASTVVNHKSIITIIGNNNTVIVEDSVQIRNSNIRLKGNNIKIVIQKNAELTGVVCSLFEDCKLSIGSSTTMGNGELTIAERCSVDIGKDCMFAHGYEIRTSDMHPIYDLQSGQRINHGKSVIVGNHVWFGRNVFVQKGVEIAQNIVVGANSVVAKSLLNENSIAVGQPAKIIKTGVIWGRKMYHQTMFDDPTLSEIIEGAISER